MKKPTLIYLISLHCFALLAFYYHSWTGLAWLVSLYLLTGFGVTVGYHRLLSHRSFDTSPWLRNTLATAGALAGEGGPLSWVSIHRLHHQKTDLEGDPHDSRKGFWWSHVGWLLDDPWNKYNWYERIDDIKKDRYLQWLNKYHLILQIALAAVIFACCLYLLSVEDAWTILIWAFPLRIIAVLHCTWLTNSAAHMYGSRAYNTADRSKNCWWVALLTLGEGWHNNHHAFPASARHGLEWYQVDLSWYVICGLKGIGLVSNIKTKKAA